MKAFIGMQGLAIFLLIISALNMFSFKINITNEINGWRLTRIAQTHAHLMASEYMQEKIGVIDPGRLRTLSSMGYRVAALLYDPEERRVVWSQGMDSENARKLGENYGDGLGLPRSFMGYENLTRYGIPMEGARYALPVVDENGNYGVLMVLLRSEEGDWVEEFRPIYSNLKELYEKEVG